MIRVQLYGMLRLMLGGTEGVDLHWQPGDTVGSVLARFQAGEQLPVTGKLLDESGELLVGTIILLNRHNIHHLERLATPVRDGDSVALFPPGAGG